ncbi:MAG: hypothetical protein NTY51_14195 [Deltaproteobacteria bacterium]|nr:hypothetical protein [Deltaproteobacteria bacterium]
MQYTAIISSDWNECLAPCGPFDPIAFTYPDLTPNLNIIFRRYTRSEISLTQAVADIRNMLPKPLSVEQMDNYLEKSFYTYLGVPEFIEWARTKGILFMINTTGMQGYFQRVLSKKLLPDVPLIAANPLIKYPDYSNDPRYAYSVMEIHDKPVNTMAAISAFGLRSDRVVIIGDSGGDGPHFEWGASVGALLIGSMTKASLTSYCEGKQVQISERFGVCYLPGQARIVEEEIKYNFMELTSVIDDFLGSRIRRG